MKTSPKTIKRQVRRARIRSKVSGTLAMPRLSVFKSNKFISAQLIDDEKGVTLAQAQGKSLKAKTKTDQAVLVGKEIAKLALAKGISKVVFDRGGYIYTGKIKALADSAREGGLKF